MMMPLIKTGAIKVYIHLAQHKCKGSCGRQYRFGYHCWAVCAGTPFIHLNLLQFPSNKEVCRNLIFLKKLLVCFWATEIGVFLSRFQWNIYNHGKQEPTNTTNKQSTTTSILYTYSHPPRMLHRRFSQFITNSVHKKLAIYVPFLPCCSLQPRDRKTEMMLWYGKGNGVIATSAGWSHGKNRKGTQQKKGGHI